MICSRGHLEPRRASAMSNRSFINRAAEERGQRLVVGRVVAGNLCLVDRLECIEQPIAPVVGIGGFALPLHRVEIVHIGRIGLFIVAEQTHRISRLYKTLLFDAFSSRSKTLCYSTTFGTRKK